MTTLVKHSLAQSSTGFYFKFSRAINSNTYQPSEFSTRDKILYKVDGALPLSHLDVLAGEALKS